MLLFFISEVSYVYGQMAIGSDTVQKDAILYLVPNGKRKGIILPKVTKTLYNSSLFNCNVSRIGLMFFDETDSTIRFCNGFAWQSFPVSDTVQFITKTNYLSADSIRVRNIDSATTIYYDSIKITSDFILTNVKYRKPRQDDTALYYSRSEKQYKKIPFANLKKDTVSIYEILSLNDTFRYDITQRGDYAGYKSMYNLDTLGIHRAFKFNFLNFGQDTNTDSVITVNKNGELAWANISSKFTKLIAIASNGVRIKNDSLYLGGSVNKKTELNVLGKDLLFNINNPLGSIKYETNSDTAEYGDSVIVLNNGIIRKVHPFDLITDTPGISGVLLRGEAASINLSGSLKDSLNILNVDTLTFKKLVFYKPNVLRKAHFANDSVLGIDSGVVKWIDVRYSALGYFRGANNGLSFIDDSVSLGGKLLTNTTIDLNNKNLTFNKSGVNGQFRVIGLLDTAVIGDSILMYSFDGIEGVRKVSPFDLITDTPGIAGLLKANDSAGGLSLYNLDTLYARAIKFTNLNKIKEVETDSMLLISDTGDLKWIDFYKSSLKSFNKANNGLTNKGDTLKLGGELKKNTILLMDSMPLIFSLDPSKAGKIRITNVPTSNAIEDSVLILKQDGRVHKISPRLLITDTPSIYGFILANASADNQSIKGIDTITLNTIRFLNRDSLYYLNNGVKSLITYDSGLTIDNNGYLKYRFIEKKIPLKNFFRNGITNLSDTVNLGGELSENTSLVIDTPFTLISDYPTTLSAEENTLSTLYFSNTNQRYTYTSAVAKKVRLFMIGAGGGGGSVAGNGGGSGGYTIIDDLIIPAGKYFIKAGAGGQGAIGTTGNLNGENGDSTYFYNSDKSILFYSNGGKGGNNNQNSPVTASSNRGDTTIFKLSPSSFFNTYSNNYGRNGGDYVSSREGLFPSITGTNYGLSNIILGSSGDAGGVSTSTIQNNGEGTSGYGCTVNINGNNALSKGSGGGGAGALSGSAALGFTPCVSNAMGGRGGDGYIMIEELEIIDTSKRSRIMFSNLASSNLQGKNILILDSVNEVRKIKAYDLKTDTAYLSDILSVGNSAAYNKGTSIDTLSIKNVNELNVNKIRLNKNSLPLYNDGNDSVLGINNNSKLGWVDVSQSKLKYFKTALNGLTKIDDTVMLGGKLLKNTTLDFGSNDLIINHNVPCSTLTNYTDCSVLKFNSTKDTAVYNDDVLMLQNSSNINEAGRLLRVKPNLLVTDTPNLAGILFKYGPEAKGVNILNVDTLKAKYYSIYDSIKIKKTVDYKLLTLDRNGNLVWIHQDSTYLIVHTPKVKYAGDGVTKFRDTFRIGGEIKRDNVIIKVDSGSFTIQANNAGGVNGKTLVVKNLPFATANSTDSILLVDKDGKLKAIALSKFIADTPGIVGALISGKDAKNQNLFNLDTISLNTIRFKYIDSLYLKDNTGKLLTMVRDSSLTITKDGLLAWRPLSTLGFELNMRLPATFSNLKDTILDDTLRLGGRMYENSIINVTNKDLTFNKTLRTHGNLKFVNLRNAQPQNYILIGDTTGELKYVHAFDFAGDTATLDTILKTNNYAGIIDFTKSPYDTLRQNIINIDTLSVKTLAFSNKITLIDSASLLISKDSALTLRSGYVGWTDLTQPKLKYLKRAINGMEVAHENDNINLNDSIRLGSSIPFEDSVTLDLNDYKLEFNITQGNYNSSKVIISGLQKANITDSILMVDLNGTLKKVHPYDFIADTPGIRGVMAKTKFLNTNANNLNITNVDTLHTRMVRFRFIDSLKETISDTLLTLDTNNLLRVLDFKKSSLYGISIALNGLRRNKDTVFLGGKLTKNTSLDLDTFLTINNTGTKDTGSVRFTMVNTLSTSPVSGNLYQGILVNKDGIIVSKINTDNIITDTPSIAGFAFKENKRSAGNKNIVKLDSLKVKNLQFLDLSVLSTFEDDGFGGKRLVQPKRDSILTIDSSGAIRWKYDIASKAKFDTLARNGIIRTIGGNYIEYGDTLLNNTTIDIDTFSFTIKQNNNSLNGMQFLNIPVTENSNNYLLLIDSLNNLKKVHAFDVYADTPNWKGVMYKDSLPYIALTGDTMSIFNLDTLFLNRFNSKRFRELGVKTPFKTDTVLGIIPVGNKAVINYIPVSYDALKYIGFARNGLSGNSTIKGSDTLKLGGTLSQNTDFTLNDYDLTINKTGTGNLIFSNLQFTNMLINRDSILFLDSASNVMFINQKNFIGDTASLKGYLTVGNKASKDTSISMSIDTITLNDLRILSFNKLPSYNRDSILVTDTFGYLRYYNISPVVNALKTGLNGVTVVVDTVELGGVLRDSVILKLKENNLNFDFGPTSSGKLVFKNFQNINVIKKQHPTGDSLLLLTGSIGGLQKIQKISPYEFITDTPGIAGVLKSGNDALESFIDNVDTLSIKNFLFKSYDSLSPLNKINKNLYKPSSNTFNISKDFSISKNGNISTFSMSNSPDNLVDSLVSTVTKFNVNYSELTSTNDAYIFYFNLSKSYVIDSIIIIVPDSSKDIIENAIMSLKSIDGIEKSGLTTLGVTSNGGFTKWKIIGPDDFVKYIKFTKKYPLTIASGHNNDRERTISEFQIFGKPNKREVSLSDSVLSLNRNGQLAWKSVSKMTEQYILQGVNGLKVENGVLGLGGDVSDSVKLNIINKDVTFTKGPSNTDFNLIFDNTPIVNADRQLDTPHNVVMIDAGNTIKKIKGNKLSSRIPTLKRVLSEGGQDADTQSIYNLDTLIAKTLLWKNASSDANIFFLKQNKVLLTIKPSNVSTNLTRYNSVYKNFNANGGSVILYKGDTSLFEDWGFKIAFTSNFVNTNFIDTIDYFPTISASTGTNLNLRYITLMNSVVNIGSLGNVYKRIPIKAQVKYFEFYYSKNTNAGRTGDPANNYKLSVDSIAIIGSSSIDYYNEDYSLTFDTSSTARFKFKYTKDQYGQAISIAGNGLSLETDTPSNLLLGGKILTDATISTDKYDLIIRDPNIDKNDQTKTKTSLKFINNQIPKGSQSDRVLTIGIRSKTTPYYEPTINGSSTLVNLTKHYLNERKVYFRQGTVGTGDVEDITNAVGDSCWINPIGAGISPSNAVYNRKTINYDGITDGVFKKTITANPNPTFGWRYLLSKECNAYTDNEDGLRRYKGMVFKLNNSDSTNAEGVKFVKKLYGITTHLYAGHYDLGGGKYNIPLFVVLVDEYNVEYVIDTLLGKRSPTFLAPMYLPSNTIKDANGNYVAANTISGNDDVDLNTSNDRVWLTSFAKIPEELRDRKFKYLAYTLHPQSTFYAVLSKSNTASTTSTFGIGFNDQAQSVIDWGRTNVENNYGVGTYGYFKLSLDEVQMWGTVDTVRELVSVNPVKIKSKVLSPSAYLLKNNSLSNLSNKNIENLDTTEVLNYKFYNNAVTNKPNLTRFERDSILVLNSSNNLSFKNINNLFRPAYKKTLNGDTVIDLVLQLNKRAFIDSNVTLHLNKKVFEIQFNDTILGLKNDDSARLVLKDLYNVRNTNYLKDTALKFNRIAKALVLKRDTVGKSLGKPDSTFLGLMSFSDLETDTAGISGVLKIGNRGHIYNRKTSKFDTLNFLNIDTLSLNYLKLTKKYLDSIKVAVPTADNAVSLFTFDYGFGNMDNDVYYVYLDSATSYSYTNTGQLVINSPPLLSNYITPVNITPNIGFINNYIDPLTNALSTGNGSTGRVAMLPYYLSLTNRNVVNDLGKDNIFALQSSSGSNTNNWGLSIKMPPVNTNLYAKGITIYKAPYISSYYYGNNDTIFRGLTYEQSTKSITPIYIKIVTDKGNTFYSDTVKSSDFTSDFITFDFASMGIRLGHERVLTVDILNPNTTNEFSDATSIYNKTRFFSNIKVNLVRGKTFYSSSVKNAYLLQDSIRVLGNDTTYEIKKIALDKVNLKYPSIMGSGIIRVDTSTLSLGGVFTDSVVFNLTNLDLEFNANPYGPSTIDVIDTFDLIDKFYNNGSVYPSKRNKLYSIETNITKLLYYCKNNKYENWKDILANFDSSRFNKYHDNFNFNISGYKFRDYTDPETELHIYQPNVSNSIRKYASLDYNYYFDKSTPDILWIYGKTKYFNIPAVPTNAWMFAKVRFKNSSIGPRIYMDSTVYLLSSDTFSTMTPNNIVANTNNFKFNLKTDTNFHSIKYNINDIAIENFSMELTDDRCTGSSQVSTLSNTNYYNKQNNSTILYAGKDSIETPENSGRFYYKLFDCKGYSYKSWDDVLKYFDTSEYNSTSTNLSFQTRLLSANGDTTFYSGNNGVSYDKTKQLIKYFVSPSGSELVIAANIYDKTKAKKNLTFKLKFANLLENNIYTPYFYMDSSYATKSNTDNATITSYFAANTEFLNKVGETLSFKTNSGNIRIFNFNITVNDPRCAVSSSKTLKFENLPEVTSFNNLFRSDSLLFVDELGNIKKRLLDSVKLSTKNISEYLSNNNDAKDTSLFGVDNIVINKLKIDIKKVPYVPVGGSNGKSKFRDSILTVSSDGNLQLSKRFLFTPTTFDSISNGLTRKEVISFGTTQAYLGGKLNKKTTLRFEKYPLSFSISHENDSNSRLFFDVLKNANFDIESQTYMLKDTLLIIGDSSKLYKSALNKYTSPVPSFSSLIANDNYLPVDTAIRPRSISPAGYDTLYIGKYDYKSGMILSNSQFDTDLSLTPTVRFTTPIKISGLLKYPNLRDAGFSAKTLILSKGKYLKKSYIMFGNTVISSAQNPASFTNVLLTSSTRAGNFSTFGNLPNTFITANQPGGNKNSFLDVNFLDFDNEFGHKVLIDDGAYSKSGFSIGYKLDNIFLYNDNSSFNLYFNGSYDANPYKPGDASAKFSSPSDVAPTTLMSFGKNTAFNDDGYDAKDSSLFAFNGNYLDNFYVQRHNNIAYKSAFQFTSDCVSKCKLGITFTNNTTGSLVGDTAFVGMNEDSISIFQNAANKAINFYNLYADNSIMHVDTSGYKFSFGTKGKKYPLNLGSPSSTGGSIAFPIPSISGVSSDFYQVLDTNELSLNVYQYNGIRISNDNYLQIGLDYNYEFLPTFSVKQDTFAIGASTGTGSVMNVMFNKYSGYTNYITLLDSLNEISSYLNPFHYSFNAPIIESQEINFSNDVAGKLLTAKGSKLGFFTPENFYNLDYELLNIYFNDKDASNNFQLGNDISSNLRITKNTNINNLDSIKFSIDIIKPQTKGIIFGNQKGQLFADSTGKFGFGTTSPKQLLHISRDTASLVLVQNTDIYHNLEGSQNAYSIFFSLGDDLDASSTKSYNSSITYYPLISDTVSIKTNTFYGNGLLRFDPISRLRLVNTLDTSIYMPDGSYKLQNSFDTTFSLGSIMVDFTKKYVYFGSLVANASDLTLKKDIKPLEPVLDKIMNIRGVSYNWKGEENNKTKNYGLIVQDILPYFPEIISGIEDTSKIMSLNYDHFYPILIKAIQERQINIDKQENEINNLMKLAEQNKKDLLEIKNKILKKNEQKKANYDVSKSSK